MTTRADGPGSARKSLGNSSPLGRRTPIYATRNRLTSWRTSAGLTDAEALALAGKVAALVAAINRDPYNGLVDEADNAQASALAATLAVSVSDLYKVAKLAEAAGLLVKVG